MGKWTARLADFLSTPQEATDRTDKRGDLSALAVPTEGGAEISLFTSAVDEVALAAVAWTEQDISRFIARRSRLLMWGWPEQEAEEVAERLTRRDRDPGGDDRAACAECQHYRPSRCRNHTAAQLGTSEVGRDLAGRLQRCPGYAPMPAPQRLLEQEPSRDQHSSEEAK